MENGTPPIITVTKYETVGEYLRANRKHLGLKSDEVSRITKISAAYIEAIEYGDFSLFSSPQLLKGYVKLIAKTVKADEKTAISLLESGLKEGFKDKRIEDIVGARFKEEIQKSRDFRKKILIIFFGGILIIILSYASIKLYDYIKILQAQGIYASSSRPSVAASKKNVAEKSGNAINNVTLKKDYAAVLKGKVVRRTWVAVKIDGGRIKTSMLYAGESKVWKAKKKLRIKIGNAGGIILNYNGKALGKPGGEKQVVTLNFPPKHKAEGNK